jgi:ribosomal protein S18 acetylase RimI-like enzyme
MTYVRRAFHGEADVPRILGLARCMPLSCRHVLDLPWRLSSPTLTSGRDTALWETAQELGMGQTVAFAAWQEAWAVLDFFILPGLPAAERHALETDLFAWAEQRFRERDAERGRPLPYAVEVREDDVERQQVVEAHGFVLDDDAHGYVVLSHPLVELGAVPTPPAGFILRPLQGEQEAPACATLQQAAFKSTSMTPEWRAHTLRMPPYCPGLDVVITAPDGTLAGFCVGWLDLSRHIAQIEPIGVHPRFQGLGLSRVLLLEMLRRFRAHGASSVLVETTHDRTKAIGAYEAIGFQPIHTVRRKAKWVSAPA